MMFALNDVVLRGERNQGVAGLVKSRIPRRNRGEESRQGSRSRRFRARGLDATLCGFRSGRRGPVGGGKYNLTDIGSEAMNFKKRGQYVYGYFETVGAHLKTNLQRIDRASSDASALDDVLVVFVAPHPERGQVVVGWYKAAKVFRDAQNSTGPRR